MISMGMRDNNGIHLFHAVLPEILRHPRTMLHISRINKRKLSISFNKDGVSLSDIKTGDLQISRRMINEDSQSKYQHDS